MAVSANTRILLMLYLLFAPAVCVQKFASASETLIKGVKSHGASGATSDDKAGRKFDDKFESDVQQGWKLDDKSGGLLYHGKAQSRVTAYDTAQWLAIGEMNKLGVTRYTTNTIAKKKRDDGNFFWADSVNREGNSVYHGAKDLTESVSWGWHHPSGLYGTIPVGSPLIDDDMNIYLASDDAIRKFDVNGTIMWSYAPRGQLAAAPALSSGCAPRLSSNMVFDISAEEEDALRPDWLRGSGSSTEHPVQFFKDFKVGDLVKVKAGASYRADGRELYTAGDQGLISGVVPGGEGKYGRAVIEWVRTGRKSAVQFDAIQSHFVRVEQKVATCTPVLVGSTTSGFVFAIELSTGYEVWALQGSSTIAGVKGALASKDGIVVVATNRCTDRYCYRYRNQTNVLMPGNTVVRGLNPANGIEVWSFVPEAPVWNMNPVWGPDDTVIFNDQEGSVYCLTLSTGSQVWKGDGKLGTYTEAAAVYDAGNNVVIALGMLQYDAFLPHRAHNNPVGCNPYVAPGILPRCGNAPFKQGFVRGYNGTSGRLQWEKSMPQPPASAVVGRPAQSAGFKSHVVLTLGHNCARGSPTKILLLDPLTGSSYSVDGPTLWSGMCAGDKEGGDIRRAMGGRAACNPGSWSAPVVDKDGDVYVGNQVGVYQRWGSPTGYGTGTGRRDFQLLSSLVTGVAFQDGATALADGLMAVATCTSLIVFQTANFSEQFANTTWSFPQHGYAADFNESSAAYTR